MLPTYIYGLTSDPTTHHLLTHHDSGWTERLEKMVFARLTPQDKDAFFSLLDE